MDVQLVAQVGSLLASIVWNSVCALLALPHFLAQACLRSSIGRAVDASGDVTFYEGVVTHVRHRPKRHAFRHAPGLLCKCCPSAMMFTLLWTALPESPVMYAACTRRYNVRTALLDLDSPPAWFTTQAADHMTADRARAYAGTSGAACLQQCVIKRCVCVHAFYITNLMIMLGHKLTSESW
jgi:hypothetical protein